MPFGLEELEWRGHPTVKIISRYVYSFWHDPRTWQTHKVLCLCHFITLNDILKGVYSDTTQLNWTELNWPSWTAYSQVSRVFVYDVTTYKLSQLLFTLSSWVQLSCVAINGPLDNHVHLNDVHRRHHHNYFMGWVRVSFCCPTRCGLHWLKFQ